MFLSWSKPRSDPAECGLIGTTQTKVSGGKKVSVRKKSERRTKSILKKREETLAATYNPSIYENFIVLVKNESQLRGQGTDEVEFFSGSRFAVHTWYRLQPHGNS